MYLLVFITLVISLIGIYTQVLSLQAARLAAGQSAIAQAMIRWHETAIQQVRTAQITTIPGTNGCDLTSPGAAGTPCSSVNGPVTVTATFPGAPWQNCPPAIAGQPCWNLLPPGYQTNFYSFYSIYYQPAAGQNYVITFVQKPAVANPGFIVLPNNPASVTIGINMGDLMNQIRNTGLNPITYGTVSGNAGAGGLLTTQAVSNVGGGPLASLTYTTPAAVNNGAIGIISAP
jgi:hypothetical protein